MPVVTKFFRNRNDLVPLEDEINAYIKDNNIHKDDIKKMHHNTCYDSEEDVLWNTVMLVYFRNMTDQERSEWRKSLGIEKKGNDK